MVKLTLKWNKEKIPEFELDKEQGIAELQSVVYSLTNVLPEKQKLIFKGSMLKQDKDLDKIKGLSSAQVVLMGTAENKNSAMQQPAQKTVFVEDLTQDQIKAMKMEKKQEVLPTGLVNMGNTCYLNAVVQCLKRVDELRKGLAGKGAGMQVAGQLTASLSRLWTQLDSSSTEIRPYALIEQFGMAFPHLAEMSPQGGFKQQDADESFQSIVQVLEQTLAQEGKDQEEKNLIKDLFNIQFETTMKNLELEGEESVTRLEDTKKLSCVIDNQGEPVDGLLQGVEVGLTGTIEKQSELDGQNHIYQKNSRIAKLPSYLVVQMVRFFWKDKSAVAGTDATKAKILRNVSFPRVLDVFSLCSEKLQTQLNFGRELEKKQEEQKKTDQQEKFERFKEEQNKKAKKSEDMQVEVESKELFKQFKVQQKEEEMEEHRRQLYKVHGMGLETGNFELVGVLTHKGRTADSGHYVAWVHQKGDQWAKFDDEVVTFVKTEEVLALRGGGDWHMAYYCIYRKLEVE